MGEGTGDAFSGSNGYIWLTGGVLTVAALHYDHEIYRNNLGRKQFKFANEVGDVMGTGIPGAGLAALILFSGWIVGSQRMVGAGAAHSEALIATFFYTSVLKLAIERDRNESFAPPGQENQFNSSFPSGHTSTAFATAGNLWATTGPWLGIPSFLLAGLTGYSRVQQNAHYTADVIFGATLGLTMGLGFYQHHKKGRQIGWQFLPYFNDRGSWGLQATYRL